MVRLRGDESQHYVKSPPSLSVKIPDGNLNNFTDFILFRPDAKGADDEIFTSTLAKYLGFISPDNFMSMLILMEQISNISCKKELQRIN